MSSAPSPYQIPKEPGRWRALLLAALVHLALLVFFWIGIRWQNHTPMAVEAEVWDTQVREAAPPPPPPAPVVEPKPEPPPKPVEAPKPVETPKVVTPPLPKPDIALEQEKKRKAEEKREHDRKLAEQKAAEQKAEAEKKAAEKKAAEKKAAEQKLAEQKKREEEAKRKEAEQKKLALEKQKKLKEQAEKEKAEQLAADQRHQENLKRMQAQAGGTAGGEATKSTGPRSTDPSYAQRVAAKIRSNTTYVVPASLSGNPPVEYDVQLLPDGSVRGIRKLRSSGVPGFDEAVARAIERSQPFPADRSGAVPGSFNLLHRPKDQ